MGTLLVLVSPCFRENVVVTCKIGSFLCSLDNLLQKNVIAVFFFGNQISKWRIWKKGYFWPTFHIFLVTRESYKNSFSAYLTHIHTCLLLTLLTFLPYQFWNKNKNLSGMVSLWYDSWCWFLFAPFWNNQWITKWWAKFELECLLLICIHTNAKFIVICKPRTLYDEGEDAALASVTKINITNRSLIQLRL